MTENEMLLALSNMLDPIKSDIKEMKSDISGLKGDVQVLKDDMQEVKGRVKKIELTQENVILPRLQNIEACYTSTYDRYKESVEDHEEMKQDISILKKVVAEHSEKLQRIS